ncbi:uncharacterized protein LOC103316219 [Nasonia vitripennis]|uniref:Uncharacterized protein n=1 Tax=Nasonia vitripennis TaxID=7425 RepID=A0A7M7LQY7_NASVI|nr:uncharacterized protein LOC103316219 [Nasonia vitripennis]
MSPVTDRLLPLLLLLISTASFDLTFAQQQLNSNPTLCNQPLPPSLNNLFRDNGVNDLAWRQAIGPYGRFGLGWKMPDPWSRVPQEYPVPDPSTGMFDPSWRGSCGQSPWIQPPPPIIPPIKPPNWPYYPWNSPVCQQTPARIDQQQELDADDDDDDADEEDVNINSNTNTNSNVKDPRFLQAVLRNLKGTVDEDGEPVFSNQ